MASISGADVKHVVVACEAGMGSSVMVARMLAKQLKANGVEVTHSPVNQLADTTHDLCWSIVASRSVRSRPFLTHL
jgi:mannitol-specific phosphotransferase system IIBC component